jgi:valyl-tRNA synthetase
VRSIRNLRSEKGIAPNRLLPATFVTSDQGALLDSQMHTIASLANLNKNEITVLPSLSAKPDGYIPLTISGVEVYLPLAGMFDLAAEKERLSGELSEINAQIRRLTELLSGPFAIKAPVGIVDKEREKLETYRSTAVKLEEQIADLEQ